jgi:hypothetical protein
MYCFQVLDILFWGPKASHIAWTSFMDSSDKYVAIFDQKSMSFSTLKFSGFCALISSRFESGRLKTNADSHWHLYSLVKLIPVIN